MKAAAAEMACRSETAWGREMSATAVFGGVSASGSLRVGNERCGEVRVVVAERAGALARCGVVRRWELRGGAAWRRAGQSRAMARRSFASGERGLWRGCRATYRRGEALVLVDGTEGRAVGC